MGIGRRERAGMNEPIHFEMTQQGFLWRYGGQEGDRWIAARHHGELDLRTGTLSCTCARKWSRSDFDDTLSFGEVGQWIVEHVASASEGTSRDE